MHSEAHRRAGPDVEVRQIHPRARTITVGELLGGLEVAREETSERPYTIANFVESVDGRASFQGRSGPLGSDVADRALFHGLREIADAVLVGTHTLAIERYGRLAKDPERRKRRVAAGLPPEPLAVTVTRSGEVPLDVPLFQEPDARVLVYALTELDASATAADVQVHHLDAGETTMTTVVRLLYADHGVRLLLCEGGPTMFGAMLAEGLVDELFLTLAPKLTGAGMAPTITAGPQLAHLQELSLAWALERDGTLFLRYRLIRSR